MTRFQRAGTARVIFAPAVAAVAAPTRAEIDAGNVLSEPDLVVVEGLKESAGWETTPNDVAVPDANSLQDSTIPGRRSAPTPTHTFYEDKTGPTIATALAEGTVGYVIIMPIGDQAGEECEVWPVRVSVQNRSQVNSANEAATFMVSYASTEPPTKNAVIPALV